MKRLLICLFVAIFVLGCRAMPISSERDLKRVIAQLHDHETDMEALQRLITFSGLFLYETSVFIATDNPEMDKLRREAAKAVHSRRKIETVTKALEHEDRDVRFWGVMSFESTHGKKKSWEPLLPRLKKIAVEDPDAGIRREAIHRLRSYESVRMFLSDLRKTTAESEPSVLMMLFEFDSQKPELPARFYAKAIEFLSNEDETVRAHWLCSMYFNAWNPSTAPMWRMEADPKLVQKLREIRERGTPKEQELAGKVLDALLKEGEEATQQPLPRIQQ